MTSQSDFRSRMLPVNQAQTNVKSDFRSRMLPVNLPQQNIEVFPGSQADVNRPQMPGLLSAARDVAAPAISEGVAALAGAPIDLISAIKPFHENEEWVKKYFGSAGIKKYLTEPVREKVTGKISPEQEEQTSTKYARRLGKIAGPAMAFGPGALVPAALSATAGQAAEQMGYGPTGQAIAEVAGGLTPNVLSAAKKLAKKPVTMASGLTKPRAIEAKFPKAARITPELQKKTIENLENEAVKLTKSSLEKHKPLVKKIEAGHDFYETFKKDFGEVKSLAKKYNPSIDIDPLRKFTMDARSQYKGIPSPHIEAKKIIKESREFSKKPPTNLDTLTEMYRSNNAKVKTTYETSIMSGKQKEYVDFLMDQNKAIVESIKKTLPKNSLFVKKFENANKNFKDFKDTLAAKNDLKYILGEKPSLHKLTEFAINPEKQKKLALHMGQKGADEVIQISKDLKKSTEALKNISLREIKSFEDMLPSGYFLADLIPFGSIYKKFHGLKYATSASRSAYGRFLTKPESRRAYNEALKAFATKNPEGFGIATKKLADSLDKSEE